MCAYMHEKNVAYPCSAFFSVFSCYLVLRGKEASMLWLALKTRAPCHGPLVPDALPQDATCWPTGWVDASAGQVPGTAWGSPLALRRTPARLDGHVQLLFKHCLAVYGEGRGTQLLGSSCWRSCWRWTSYNFSSVFSSIFCPWLFQWQAIQARKSKCEVLISSFLDHKETYFTVLWRYGSTCAASRRGKWSRCSPLELVKHWSRGGAGRHLRCL